MSIFTPMVITPISTEHEKGAKVSRQKAEDGRLPFPSAVNLQSIFKTFPCKK